jgi:hypothetical protein
MPVPNKHCDKCSKKMTYDPLLSRKGAKRQVRAFWCTKCEYIMTEETFEVKDVVRSMKRYIFHGKLP